MNWALLAGSLAAVLVLAGIARALGLGGADFGDEAEAEEELAQALPDFAVTSIWLSKDHATAVALGDAGSIAVIRRHGARFVARELPRTAIARVEQNRFKVISGDRWWGDVDFALPRNLGDAFADALGTGEAADTHVS